MRNLSNSRPNKSLSLMEGIKVSLSNGLLLIFTLSDFASSFVFDISIRLATGGSFMCKTFMPLLFEPKFFLRKFNFLI